MKGDAERCGYFSERNGATDSSTRCGVPRARAAGWHLSVLSSWGASRFSSCTGRSWGPSGTSLPRQIAAIWRSGPGRNSEEIRMLQKRMQLGWWSLKAICNFRSFKEHLSWQNPERHFFDSWTFIYWKPECGYNSSLRWHPGNVWRWNLPQWVLFCFVLFCFFPFFLAWLFFHVGITQTQKTPKNWMDGVARAAGKAESPQITTAVCWQGNGK